MSNRVLAKIYPVNEPDREAWWTPATFRPTVFRKHLSEGSYVSEESTTFDYNKGIARYESKRKNKVKEYPIEADTRDILSFLTNAPAAVRARGEPAVSACRPTQDL